MFAKFLFCPGVEDFLEIAPGGVSHHSGASSAFFAPLRELLRIDELPTRHSFGGRFLGVPRHHMYVLLSCMVAWSSKLAD